MTAPLYAFPLRLDWEKTQPAVPAMPFPDPIVSSRDGTMPYVVRSVELLERYAKTREFQTLVQYACGNLPHATHGRPSAESRESFSLRIQREDLRGVALYMGGATPMAAWSWTMLYTLTNATGSVWRSHPTLASFKAAL